MPAGPADDDVASDAAARRRPAGRLRLLLTGHPVLGVGLLLAAIDLLLLFPAVLGGRVLSPEDVLLFHAPLSRLRPSGLVQASNYLLSDAVEVFHPDLEWARTMIRSGHLPLWDPYVFGGWPVFASQQTAILYPLNLLAYVLPFWPALGLIAVGKTLLAGLGTWWLCRRLRLGAAPALLGAVSYSLGSYFVIWLEHPHSNVYALIPWLLGAIELVCARRRARDGGLLAALVGFCLLGGHPESTFIAALACVGFAVVCLTGPQAAGARRRALLVLAGGVLLGTAAGAVMIVPFGELAGQAPSLARGGGSGLPDRSWLSLLLPDLWGRPDGFQALGPSNYAERTFYVGALPLMLAIAGLYRPRARAQRFFIGLLVAASVLAIHVPFLTKALVDAPVFELVALDRSLILVALSLAVLAAFGLERLLAATAGERRVMLGLAAGVACAPVVYLATQSRDFAALPRFSDVAPSLWGTASSQAQTAAAAGTRWLVFAVPALGALWLLGTGVRAARAGRGGGPGGGGGGRQGGRADGGRGAGPSGARAVGLALAVGLTAADLVSLNHGYHPAISQALAEPPPTPSIAAAQAHQGHGRMVGYDAYLIPNVPSRYGLRDARGHGLPALRRYLDLWNGLGGYGFQQTRLLPGRSAGGGAAR